MLFYIALCVTIRSDEKLCHCTTSHKHVYIIGYIKYDFCYLPRSGLTFRHGSSMSTKNTQCKGFGNGLIVLLGLSQGNFESEVCYMHGIKKCVLLKVLFVIHKANLLLGQNTFIDNSVNKTISSVSL